MFTIILSIAALIYVLIMWSLFNLMENIINDMIQDYQHHHAMKNRLKGIKHGL